MIASGHLANLRMSVRLTRFELLFPGGGLLAVTAVAFLVAARLEDLAPPAICLQAYESAPPADCEAAAAAFYELQGRVGVVLTALLVGIPLLAGAMLGITVVAREIERGTARLAWSLATSRVRWFLARLLPILALFAAITFVAGVGADRLEASFRPGVDMTTSFDAFGTRGVLVAARALLVLAIAVAVGAVMGRVLPSLLVTAAIAAFALPGISMVHQAVLRGEAVPHDDFQYDSGALYVDQLFRIPDGRLVGWDYFTEIREEPYDFNGNARYPEVIMAVPGERYRFVELREVAALGGASLIVLVLALAVTNRRRPD